MEVVVAVPRIPTWHPIDCEANAIFLLVNQLQFVEVLLLVIWCLWMFVLELVFEASWC